MNVLDTIHAREKDIDNLKKSIESEPSNWATYQKDINRIIDAVFNLCWEFERQNADEEPKLYKLKRLFSKNFTHYFRLGSLGRMVIDKPCGYHGDFLIIDEIYKNEAKTLGLERCLDNYFLNTPASIATRNRKEDFKNYLKEIIHKTSSDIRIMDLASGPCRDIKELMENVRPGSVQVTIDCVDHDLNAISYGKNILDGISNCQINFIQKNAMRIALTKSVENYFSEKYDVIFSTGLFDYLDERIATPLIRNLRTLLKKDGLLIISNYRDKWANPSRHYMEWGGGWELIYRTEDQFTKLFKDAGFMDGDLSLKYEPQKIMQYRFARN